MAKYQEKERAPRYSEPLERWRRAAIRGDEEAMRRADFDWRRNLRMPQARATIDRYPGRGYGLIGKVAS